MRLRGSGSDTTWDGDVEGTEDDDDEVEETNEDGEAGFSQPRRYPRRE